MYGLAFGLSNFPPVARTLRVRGPDVIPPAQNIRRGHANDLDQGKIGVTLKGQSAFSLRDTGYHPDRDWSYDPTPALVEFRP